MHVFLTMKNITATHTASTITGLDWWTGGLTLKIIFMLF